MEYKNPLLTVDGVLIQDEKILLVKRGIQPFKDEWALPGGFVEYGETTEEAVKREFFEETSLQVRPIELFGVYSDPSRDPRGHTITIVYILELLDGDLKHGDDAADTCYFSLTNLPDLAFDHFNIINDFLRRKRK